MRTFFTKEGSEASTTPIASEATTTGGSPPTPPVDFEAAVADPLKNNSLNGLLPSAASVVRALSPLLTPAFKAAANNMSQKVLKATKEAVQGVEPQQPHVGTVVEEEQVVHKITPEELPMMSQVKLDDASNFYNNRENFFDICQKF